MTELPFEIREAVAHTAKNWPRQLDAQALLRELDALARRVYALSVPEGSVAKDGRASGAPAADAAGTAGKPDQPTR